MSRRDFIFCDICNDRAIRVIEERRGPSRGELYTGRRIIDGRAWFDGTNEEAQAVGWLIEEEDRHVCPRCRAHGLNRDFY